MTISKIAYIYANPESIQPLQQALLDLEAATLLEPGCIFFSFYQSLSDKKNFVLIECFADQQALEQHMQLPHTVHFFGLNLVQSIVVSEMAQNNLPKTP
ncbi:MULTISPECIES: putative quinol monooxygenase [Giesbergeria]|uniref:Quinol monooxygenase n=1 Tax=Giesbergeria sinuosa TaxID=80883 RepID=A0ABV9QA77_9BURK